MRGGAPPVAERFARSFRAACLGDLFPDAGRLDQLTAKLGAPTQALERDEPTRVVLPGGPDLERAPAQTRRVSIGVDGAKRLDGCKEFRSRPLGFVAAPSQCSATSCGGAPVLSRFSATGR